MKKKSYFDSLSKEAQEDIKIMMGEGKEPKMIPIKPGETVRVRFEVNVRKSGKHSIKRLGVKRSYE